jgi:hypothetical protein
VDLMAEPSHHNETDTSTNRSKKIKLLPHRYRYSGSRQERNSSGGSAYASPSSWLDRSNNDLVFPTGFIFFNSQRALGSVTGRLGYTWGSPCSMLKAASLFR